MLRSSGDFGLNSELIQLLPQHRHHFTHVGFAFGLASRDHLLNLGVLTRFQRRKRQILHFRTNTLNTESVGNRGVDVTSLECGRALFGDRHHSQRAHIVQSIGELDHDDPQVPRHGDEHLPDGRRLLLLFRRKVQTIEFGHSVDDVGHRVAKLVT